MTISPLAVTSPDAATSSPATSAAAPATNAGSINSLTPTDFIQMLAAELQNQDPSNPTDPSQILQQTSMIANMESMTNMSTAVQSEQAAGLIGETITGTNLAGRPVTGTVTDVHLDPASGAPNLMVNGVAVPLSAVTDITSTGLTNIGTTNTGSSSTGSPNTGSAGFGSSSSVTNSSSPSSPSITT